MVLLRPKLAVVRPVSPYGSVSADLMEQKEKSALDLFRQFFLLLFGPAGQLYNPSHKYTLFVYQIQAFNLSNKKGIYFQAITKNKKPPHRQNPGKGGFTFDMAGIRDPSAPPLNALIITPIPLFSQEDHPKMARCVQRATGKRLRSWHISFLHPSPKINRG